MIPRAEDFAAEDYDGFFLHVGEKTPGELDVSTLQNCDFNSWSPQDVTYRKGTLVDHIGNEVERVPTTIYTNVAEDVRTGSLWTINNTVSCPKEFVGLRIEQISAAVSGNVTSTETQNEGGAGAFGPGFGAFGVAAAAGVGGLIALLRGDDD